MISPGLFRFELLDLLRTHQAKLHGRGRSTARFRFNDAREWAPTCRCRPGAAAAVEGIVYYGLCGKCRGRERLIEPRNARVDKTLHDGRSC
jgi:hypothetical protein